MINQFTLRVEPVLAKDGLAYVGQCVEYDLCVQGSTIKELMDRFIGSINGHIILCYENGEEPFVSLPAGKIDQVPAADPSFHRSFSMATPQAQEDKYALSRLGELNLTVA